MPIDIKFTSTGDIDLTGGDVSYTESTAQHQYALMRARKYDFRSAPGVGVDAENYLLDNTNGLLREIRLQFMKDGMTVKKVSLTGVDAQYK